VRSGGIPLNPPTLAPDYEILRKILFADRPPGPFG
jgi:hypothetical protein